MAKDSILKIGEWFTFSKVGRCRLESFISRGVYMVYHLESGRYLYVSIDHNLKIVILPRKP